MGAGTTRTMLLVKKKAKPTSPDGQMELVEHLAELRTRLFRALFYVAVGMVLTYNLFDEMFTLLQHPLQPILSKMPNAGVVITSIQQGFLLRIQVCFLSGMAAAFPFVILELWGFIAPALTPDERKPVKFLGPFSVLLFLAGLGTAYACLRPAYEWMASYITDVPGMTLLQDANQYLLLTVKILLAFGVAFELPIVLLFLARVGIISADMMVRYWRYAAVLISASAAILTPSNDPLTMMMMAVPMAGLYALSIGLVRAFEPKPDGSRGLSFATMLLVALAPVGLLAAVGYWLWRGG
jgi:sec-independent protein translocase protein TatC